MQVTATNTTNLKMTTIPLNAADRFFDALETRLNTLHHEFITTSTPMLDYLHCIFNPQLYKYYPALPTLPLIQNHPPLTQPASDNSLLDAVAIGLLEESAIRQIDFEAVLQSLQTPVVRLCQELTTALHALHDTDTHLPILYRRIADVSIRKIRAAYNLRLKLRELELVPSPQKDIKNRYDLVKNPTVARGRQISFKAYVETLALQTPSPDWHFPTAQEQDTHAENMTRSTQIQDPWKAQVLAGGNQETLELLFRKEV